MSADQLENELVRKISELQQEAKEHQLVLDAFKSVEPERKCFRLIGGVLVERTVKDIKPNLEENLVNVCLLYSVKLNFIDREGDRKHQRIHNKAPRGESEGCVGAHVERGGSDSFNRASPRWVGECPRMNVEFSLPQHRHSVHSRRSFVRYMHAFIE